MKPLNNNSLRLQDDVQEWLQGKEMIGVGTFNNAINSFFHGRKVFYYQFHIKSSSTPVRLIINLFQGKQQQLNHSMGNLLSQISKFIANKYCQFTQQSYFTSVIAYFDCSKQKLLIIIEKMAFVYRSQTAQKYPLSPGPGTYIQQQKKQNGVHSAAPFNQSSPRKLWKHTQNPGPGAYSPELKPNNPKSIFKSNASTFGIFEAPVETSIFRSSSKRFQNSKQQGPGPGEYSYEPQMRTKTRTASQSNNLQKYIQKSRIIEGQEQDSNKLAIGQESERPKYMMSKKIEKKTVPFLSQQQRARAKRPQTSLGPGSYNIQQSKQHKREANRKNVSQSIIKIKRNPIEQLHYQQMQRQIYNTEAEMFIKKSYNNRKQNFFGSSVSRFINNGHNFTPGPGQYDLNINKSTEHVVPIKKAAFGRNPINKNKQQVFISPFMNRQIKQKETSPLKQADKSKKIKQNQSGFLFKEERFKQMKGPQNINHASPNDNDLFLGKENNQEKQSKKSGKLCSFSKINIKHPNSEKNSDKRPLSYASQAFTISSKSNQKYQIKAPFMSYASRFQNKHKNQANDLIGYYSTNTISTEPRETSNAQQPMHSIQSKGIMDSGNPRFIYKQAYANISPFSYDPIKSTKKQFNKLFL